MVRSVGIVVVPAGTLDHEPSRRSTRRILPDAQVEWHGKADEHRATTRPLA
jgi:hypothetical protein